VGRVAAGGGLGPPRSLLDRTVRALQGGPRSTDWIAREVLALQGPEGAVARAVFTLLGADPRFQVDRSGVWRLDPATPPPGPSLRRLTFAVVDVETTGGGYGKGHRITEIAVVPVEAGVVGQPFSTLVHPGRSIPWRIQSLTGITDAMVAHAPRSTRWPKRYGGRWTVGSSPPITCSLTGGSWRVTSGMPGERFRRVPGCAR
jgi:hypothetical protein